MQVLAGICFGFLFGASESFLYLNPIFQLGDFGVLWQRFVWTVPMHILTVLVILFSGLAGRVFLIFGLIGAVIVHALFNAVVAGIPAS